MKILVVGSFYSDIHEKAIYDAFLKLGYEANNFGWHHYFKDRLFMTEENKKNFLKLFYYKFQNKFLIGPTIQLINRDLKKRVKDFKPDLVFIYRGTHIFPKTIRDVKKDKTLIFGYNNDDPFGEEYPAYFWRHFKKAIPYYDYIFAYRPKNILDYEKLGYKKVSLLRSYYIESKNFHLEKLPSDKYVCDVVFAGHFELDGRDEYLKKIVEAGINFKLFGPDWQGSKYHDFFEKKLGKIQFLKEDYNLALNSAKIALVFLSKLNNDTYTRRCFEIVAAKTLMLSEYSDDLDSMFKEDKEAVYFHNPEEILEKIRFYLKNETVRQKIVDAAYERLIKDGHEVKDRAQEIIKVFNSLDA